MAAVKSSNLINWILFLVSTIICVFLVVYYPAWFWVALPFVLTYLVKAFDAM